MEKGKEQGNRNKQGSSRGNERVFFANALGWHLCRTKLPRKASIPQRKVTWNRKWWRQTGLRQSTPLSTIRTRYGNSVSTPEATRTCKTQQNSLQKGSRYGISVSNPHRRYGHRLRTPFLRTPFPRLLEKSLVRRKVRRKVRKMPRNVPKNVSPIQPPKNVSPAPFHSLAAAILNTTSNTK